jgi:nucleotide-binding universal stress UspA family protein
MTRVDRILCPTDLSTESDDALRYAVALALAYEAQLLLLHCSEENAVEPEKNTRSI